MVEFYFLTYFLIGSLPRQGGGERGGSFNQALGRNMQCRKKTDQTKKSKSLKH